MLRPYQEKAVKDIREAFTRSRRVLFVLPTGGGKCLGRDTEIIMYDGTIKKVQDIIAGDKILGPDSKPRNVLSVCRGSERLYEVVQKNGSNYTVNESHILSLKETGKNKIINLSVKDYLCKNATFKHVMKGWKTGVEFDSKQVDTFLPPYLLGVWLGDGTSSEASITNVDKEVIQYLHDYANSVNLEISERLSKTRVTTFYIKNASAIHGRGHKCNGFLNALRKYDLLGNKHIPNDYLANSRTNRLELLAGIIDTDGYLHNNCIDIVFKQKELAENVCFLARSLGLRVNLSHCKKTCTNTNAVGDYYRLGISGNLIEIPCKVARRIGAERKQIKNHLVCGIKLVDKGIGEYFGFEIDGDHLFLLSDFTVTHNTFTFAHMAHESSQKGKHVLLIAHRKELIDQIKRTLAAVGCTVVHVDTVQTVARRLDKIQAPDFIIADEAHHAVAGQWAKIIEAYPKAFVLGVTATPCRLDGTALGNVFQEMVFGPSMKELIALGNLVKSKAFVRPAIDKTQLKIRCGDYSSDSIGLAIEDNKRSIFGDIVQMYKAHALGKKAVIFTHSVNMAKESCDLMNAEGFKFSPLYGAMNPAERVKVVENLRAGLLDGIASCDIVSEGFDCPALETAILLRPTKSLSLYLQQVGRVLRPAPGKEFGLILDHVGNVPNFGLPEEDREWSLEGTGKQGAAKDPEAVKLTVCKECCLSYYKAEGNICPYCGAERKPELKPIRIEHGELVEYAPNGKKVLLLSAKDLNTWNWVKDKKTPDGGPLKLLRDYQEFTVNMGKSKGWGWHLFKLSQKVNQYKGVI